MLEADHGASPSSGDTAPQTSAGNDPAREPGAFEELVREIGQDGAYEVRGVFWAETHARLRLFGDLTFEPHRARIGREAHSLKSAARTFGYLRLAALALELEKSVGTLGEADYRALLAAMDAAYAAALEQEPRG
jgi:HPt (histidine-containing phosphotransfer) domain-containing protein